MEVAYELKIEYSLTRIKRVRKKVSTLIAVLDIILFLYETERTIVVYATVALY